MCLWNEFKVGINGRKPAEKFTTRERNAKGTKQKYYRRNLIWSIVAFLVQYGRSAEMAIIQLQNSYGYTSSLSTVIPAMVRDKSNYPGGLHLNLRLVIFLACFFVSLHDCNSLIVVPLLLTLSFTQSR
jgi:hypothetical protein